MLVRVFADASYHLESQTAFWYGIVEYPNERRSFEGTFRGCETSEAAELGALLLTVRSALRGHQASRLQLFTDCEAAALQVKRRGRHTNRPARSLARAQFTECLPEGVPVDVVVVNKRRDPPSLERELIIQCDRAAYRMLQLARRGIARAKRRRVRAKQKRSGSVPINKAGLWRAVEGGGLRCPECCSSPPRACRQPSICVGTGHDGDRAG